MWLQQESLVRGLTSMDSRNAVVEQTTQIVAAYVSKNDVPRSELSKLIAEVYGALVSAADGRPVAQQAAQTAAAAAKKTVFPDYIVCLEDGKRFKSLKRHLRVKYSLTPEQYRERWGLSVDYPMVAPNYAETRSNLAKSMGLGKGPAKALRVQEG
jgi:predicted transcriptional regulator